MNKITVARIADRTASQQLAIVASNCFGDIAL